MAIPRGRLVVLDRDGVINRESPDFIRSPSEWQPLPGSLEAIAELTRGGFTVVVVTNQSGVGRGLFSAETLEAIHERLRAAVAATGGHISGIFACPHHPDMNCECRKPQPGLLRQVEDAFGVSLAGQPVVGDSLRDIEAARAVGARPILVRTGNGASTERALRADAEVEVLDDLAAVAAMLLGPTARR